MTITDATLKNNIRSIMNEPVNANGALSMVASDVPYNIDSYIDTLLPVAVSLCSISSPGGGVNTKITNSLGNSGLIIYEYTLKFTQSSASVCAYIIFNMGPSTISLSDVQTSNFAAKMKEAFENNQMLSSIGWVYSSSGNEIKLRYNSSQSISVLEIEHPLVNTISVTSRTEQGSAGTYSDGSSTVYTLPNDFIRLNGMLRVDSNNAYLRPVTSIVDVESELGKAQFNSNTKSKNDNPIISNFWCDDKRGIMVTPNVPQGMTYSFDYDAQYDSNVGLTTYHSSYASAVCFMCASLIYETFEEGTMAERMSTIAYELLGHKTEEI